MKPKIRGASEEPKRHQSFIRLRPDEPDRLGRHMRSSATGGQLRGDQIKRAKEVVERLKALFLSKDGSERGALARLARASDAAGHRLVQQTMSAVLNNGQCGYSVAEQIMAYAKTRDELADLPSNYIIAGAEEVQTGTEHAGRYASQPMKYRAKGEMLDTLTRTLPGDFLDFTAARDPIEADAPSWGPTEWFAHVAKELEVWKDRQARKIRR